MLSANDLFEFWSIAWIYFNMVSDVFSVAVTEVRVLSNSNRPEYVLHGEGATLTCHYLLEPSEEVIEVEWHKDGVLVYLWSLEDSPKAYNILKDVVDLEANVNSPSTISILRTTMEMQGTYTCKVKTSAKTAQNDAYVMVIVNACYEDDWKTYTDMIKCTETINMHCTGMYPKPSPACGVYSEKTGKYLHSIPFDSVIQLSNRTYEVSFNRKFSVEEWINHTDISFRCYMLVLGTPWRSGIQHKMFGDPGCTKAPASVHHGYYNISDEVSCWGFPAEDSKVKYHCEDGYQLLGSALHTCKSGEWVPEGIVVDGDYEIPICSNLATTHLSSPLYWTTFMFFIIKKWT